MVQYYSSNVANYIVENLEFRDLLSALDNCYPVPGSSGIQKELDQIMIELRLKFLHTYKILGL